MPKVFVPQLPQRYDAATRLFIPTVDIKPAERFGDVVVLLPPNANRLHTAPLVTALREGMRDMTEEDHLVALGDPTLIAAAACIAARMHGGLLRVLKWDRRTSDYISTELRV